MNDPNILFAAGFGYILHRPGINGVAFILFLLTPINIGIGGGIDDDIRVIIIDQFPAGIRRCYIDFIFVKSGYFVGSA